MVKIAVIGGGHMGVRIACEMIYHGHRVKLHDQNIDVLNSVYSRVEQDKLKLYQDGAVPDGHVFGQLLCLSRLSETVNDADIVFEVITENLSRKQLLFEQLSDFCKPATILATNTLQLDINLICGKCVNPERALGIRFLYPVYYIPEVEITPGDQTSLTTIEKVRKFFDQMGKVLFFKTGDIPVILSEDQQNERKRAKIDSIRISSDLQNMRLSLVSSGHDSSTDSFEDVFGTIHHDNDCAICMDNKRNCLLCPCHHLVTCAPCAEALMNRRDACPICRKDIKELIKVYHS